jgi:hypothetical protein
MSGIALSPPTGLMPRFGLFCNGLKQIMGEVMLYRHDTTPLAMLLWEFLTATQRRLTALHARFAAGTLPAVPRAPRAVPDRATADRPRAERRGAERRAPAIPAGPVLLTVFRVGFGQMLQILLDDPEMQALLAASPQARRILRPMWRKLTPDPLPAVLRLPPRPPRPPGPRKPRPPEPRQPRAKVAGAPGLRPVVLPNGFIQWERTPCLPPFPD